jgi:hypothetical protein
MQMNLLKEHPGGFYEHSEGFYERSTGLFNSPALRKL